MKKYLIVLVLFIAGTKIVKAQTCFDAYDLLFVDENKTLPYDDFHELELNFLDNLVGCNAIDFNAVSIDGKEIFLSGLKGKVVVLNFWFTTCLPCLKEIPELNTLVENYSSDELAFIGFARDDKQKLETFFEKFGAFNYTIIPDSYSIADAYKVVGWPQSMVLDKQGKVFKSWTGLHGGPELLKVEIQKAIDDCLAE